MLRSRPGGLTGWQVRLDPFLLPNPKAIRHPSSRIPSPPTNRTSNLCCGGLYFFVGQDPGFKGLYGPTTKWSRILASGRAAKTAGKCGLPSVRPRRRSQICAHFRVDGA